METRAFYVMFLACQFVWLSVSSSSPYGTNGHDVGKKGYDSDRSYGGEHRSRTSKPRSCTDRFEIKNNYIIRTQESLDNDATFIDALKVETAEMCLERCCDANGGVVDDDGTTVVCDTSVFVDGDYAFENKESNCFIFQCRFDEGERFRCKFSNHDSYVTSMFGGYGVEPYFEEEEEENEKEEEIPQTKQAPTTTTQGQWKNDEKEPTDDEDVKDVDECNEKQFQCDNGECIRLTLLCDDYDDCQDKSDETDQCTTIQDQDVTTHNGNESQPAHPTNPPKLQTTNIDQQQTTTTMPDPRDDDTIFSELANQLHKEGAKQKMQDDDDDSTEEDRQGSNQDKADWPGGRPSSEENDYKEPTSLPPRKPNDYDDDRGGYQWPPRQKGRPYEDYDRPNRPIRPNDRYGDDYSNRKRPLDEEQDDSRENTHRGGNDDDDDGGQYKNRYRGQDTKFRYDEQDSKDDDEDDKVKPIHKEDKSDKSLGRDYQDYRAKGDEQDNDSKDDMKDEDRLSSSKQRQQSSKSSSRGESTKEDWYGQAQKSADSNSMDKTRPGGGGRYPQTDDGNVADYNRKDYQDYFGNYYNDRNPNWGTPNRYPPNTYRNPYSRQGDYQDYADYSRPGNGRMSVGRGRGGAGGRGRGYWPPMKNPNSMDGNNGLRPPVEEEEEADDSQNEMDNPPDNPLDKQGDDRDQGNQNSAADIPHSRRLRPGLWKIWRYMYGSSAQDYTTEYPPNADEANNQVDETVDEPETETDNENIDLGVPDEDESNDLKSDDNMAVQNDTLHPDQGKIGNPDTTVKPQQTHKANPPSDKGSSTGNTTNNSKSNEDHSASQLPTVHKADTQSVTATAVLPLTIGLFLTMFLLLMMSCRLRYMNRRLRYGRLKTNNVHDADYLINGMYL